MQYLQEAKREGGKETKRHTESRLVVAKGWKEGVFFGGGSRNE